MPGLLWYNKYPTNTIYGENYICLIALFMIKNTYVEYVSRHMEAEAARKISDPIYHVAKFHKGYEMNYLKAVFWDYPEFSDPETIRKTLVESKNKRFRRWVLKRFLEHGRVVDTLSFFRLGDISSELPLLNIDSYSINKWKRIVEVYDQPSGK